MPNEEDYAEGEKEDYEKDLEEISSRDQYNLFRLHLFLTMFFAAVV
jgi:hypothetical protein